MPSDGEVREELVFFIALVPGRPASTGIFRFVAVVIQRKKKGFTRLHNAFEFLFEDAKPSPDVFKILATREDDLS